MFRELNRLKWGVSTCAMALSIGGGAWAQAEPPAQIETVVVTAQKRVESIQDTPLSIAAVTGDQLRQDNATNILALNNTLPNVHINMLQNIVQINIRGIGTAAITPVSESDVAFHVDGVYVARPESQADAIFDVDRVEVVNGPQGTLYGRNATGGAVNVITKDPTDTLDGFAQLTLGNYGTVTTEGAIGGPIVDGVEGRIAFQTQNRDGYGTQGDGLALGGKFDRLPLDDLNTRAVRGKLKFDLASDFTLVLAADYFHENDASTVLSYIGMSPNGKPDLATAFGGVLTGNPRDETSDFPSRTRKDDYSMTATANWAIMPEFNLTSVTGYRDTAYTMQQDYDATNADIALFLVGAHSNQLSEEFRADGHLGSFSYVAGLYYLKEHLDFYEDGTRNAVIFGGPDEMTQGLFQTAGLDTVAQAAFAQLSYEITDDIGVDVGGRYSTEKAVKRNEMISTDYVTPFNLTGPRIFQTIIPYASVRNSRFTPKATLRYKPTSDLMFYVTYSEGFKSGGFSLGSGGPPVKPEYLKDIEGGVKGQWFDNKLQADLAVFHYNYSNLQVQRTLPGGSHVTDNAGAAQVDGVELAVIALPTDNLQLTLNLGYDDARYTRYSAPDSTRPGLGIIDLDGNELADAPKLQIGGTAQYTWHQVWDGDLALRGEAHYVDRTYFNQFNLGQFSQAPYVLLDGYLNYTAPDDKWFAGLYMKNITDQKVLAFTTTASGNIGGFVEGALLPPRTFGVQVGTHF